MFEVENVMINRPMRTTMTVANQAGLNPVRATPELAISMRLESQILSRIRVKEMGSNIKSVDGVDCKILSTSIGEHNTIKIITPKLATAHLFLGTRRSETLNKIIFNIGLG
jgi:hypothetical protein